MRTRLLWLIAALASVPAMSAAAQGIAVPDTRATQRYQMQAVEGGVARLDTVTGEVVLCRARGGAMACGGGAVLPPSQDAGDRLDAIENRLDALEARVAEQHPAAPSSAEMDAALEQMERVLRAFGTIVRDMGRELGEPDTGTDGVPERT